MLDGSLQRTPLTAEEYKALAVRGAPSGRPHPKATWVHSAEAPLFDTLSGNLEVGDLWEKQPGIYYILVDPTKLRFEKWAVVDTSKTLTIGTLPRITVTGLVNGASIIDGVLTK